MIVLKRTFEVDSTLEEIQKKLDSDVRKPFIVKKYKNNYKLVSESSFGTIIATGMPEFTEGIKTFCKFSLTENNKVKVNLYTKIRIELYLTCLLWLSVILVAIFGKERISDKILREVPRKRTIKLCLV